MQKSQIEYLNTNELIPYARNSRAHSDAQVAQIAASIREFGFTNPVLISDNKDIIAGHGRVMAAMKLGLDQVPCIRLSHLSETQRKAYIIADNKLSENSSWDLSLLSLELEELNERDFNTDLLGFDNIELDRYLNGDNEDYSDKKDLQGSKELSEDQFSNFAHKCPRCGFEFDNA